jgi:hypothetical protein
MAPDDFTRSVRSSKNDRAPGDAPRMGKVARMPGTGLPKGVRRKRRKSEGGKGSRLREGRRMVVATWSFLLASVAVVLLGLVVWLWLIPHMMHKPESGATGQPVGLEKESSITSKFPSPSEPMAIALVKEALAVRDVEKVTDYFRLGSAKPQAVVDFLTDLDRVEGAFLRGEWLSSIDANGLALDGVLVTFKGLDNPRKRMALLTPDAKGEWKLDFDAFARTVSPGWSEILGKNPPAVACVRVYVATDSYYNGPFSDDKVWNCCCLASPDTDEQLLGYFKIDSPQASALTRILSRERQMPRAILEIRRVQGAEPRQFEISRVLAEDWVMGPVPFDESSQ